MLDADDLVRAMRAAAFPEQPVTDFGLDDTDEVRAAVEQIRREVGDAGMDIPAEFPDAGSTDDTGLYSQSVEDLVESIYGERPDDESTEAQVTKSVGEHQFTLGPMYVPGRLDAHEEWTDSGELQKAVWSYVDSGDRDIRLQHNKDIVAGHWSEIVTWPYEVTVPMHKADGTSEPMTFPANTVFLGVHWEDWAWDLVKKGKLRGYSVGGRAKRILVDLETAA